MRILMLVNWKIKYTDTLPASLQPPDYFVKGEKYWFFRYFENKDVTVDVIDIHSFGALENFEKNRIRFYIWQTLKALPVLHNYDVVISHGMQSGIVLGLIRRIFGKGKYRHIVFDIGAFNSARESGRALKFMQFAGKSIDGIIYHTESQRDYYAKCHPWLLDRSVFIPFGTDVDFFEYDSNEDGSRPGINGDKPYILCAGYHQRDWKTLVMAYKLCNHSCRLRLLGCTDLKNDPLIASDPDIEVLPGTDVSGFKEHIKGAAFCVLPLENLNFSFGQMTLLQQMAMGKAVITANVPSVRAYTHRNATFEYAPGNSAQLAELMDRLASDPALCRETGKRAAALVRSDFDERTMALAIEKALTELRKC